MNRFVILLLLCAGFSLPAHATDACPALKPLKQRVVQLLREGRGAGSGVLLDDRHVLTANHVIHFARHRDNIWLRTPHDPLALIRAEIIASSVEADLALLKLYPTQQEQLPPLAPLQFSTPRTGDTLTHMGYAFGQMYRFGAIEGIYKGAQMTSGQPAPAAHVTLSAPAFGGDSGGPLWTCAGQLAGIEFANRGHEGLPHEAYFVTAQSVQNLLKSLSK